MPGGDGTGPLGSGAMKGRIAGFCSGFTLPGYANPIGRAGFFGRGQGCGLGRGRGYRNRFYTNIGISADLPVNEYTSASFSKEKEVNILKNQAKVMQDEINAVNNRINELEEETTLKKE